MTSPARDRITSRPPIGQVGHPVVLLDGDEGGGKSWEAARLHASERVSPGFWLDLNEGAGDDYAGVVFCANCTDSVFDLQGTLVHKQDWQVECEGDNGTVAEAGASPRYEVVQHNGQYAVLLDQVQAISAHAREVLADGGPPVVLTIDTYSTFYEALKDWGNARMVARLHEKGMRPGIDAPVKWDGDLWDDVNGRYRKMMTALLMFPGIVVLTARGKEVAEAVDGVPVPGGATTWKTEGEANLRYDVTVNVRMRREHGPLLVKARSPYIGVKPGADKPRALPNFSLEWLLFDAMRYDPTAAPKRDVVNPTGSGPLAPHEQQQALARSAEEQARRQATTPPVAPAAARRQPPARQRQQPAQQAAQQPVQPDLPHVLTATTDDAARAMLLAEVDILAGIVGGTPDEVSKRWQAANDTTLDKAAPPILVGLVRYLRGAALNRLATDGRESEALALGPYVKAEAPIDLRAILDASLGAPAAEEKPAA